MPRRPALAYFGFSPHLTGKHLRGVGVENRRERRPGDASKLVVPSNKNLRCRWINSIISCAYTHDSFTQREWIRLSHCVRERVGPLFTSLSEAIHGSNAAQGWVILAKGWGVTRALADNAWWGCVYTDSSLTCGERVLSDVMRVTWCKHTEREVQSREKEILWYKSAL